MTNCGSLGLRWCKTKYLVLITTAASSVKRHLTYAAPPWTFAGNLHGLEPNAGRSRTGQDRTSNHVHLSTTSIQCRTSHRTGSNPFSEITTDHLSLLGRSWFLVNFQVLLRALPDETVRFNPETWTTAKLRNPTLLPILATAIGPRGDWTQRTSSHSLHTSAAPSILLTVRIYAHPTLVVHLARYDHHGFSVASSALVVHPHLLAPLWQSLMTRRREYLPAVSALTS